MPHENGDGRGQWWYATRYEGPDDPIRERLGLGRDGLMSEHQLDNLAAGD